MTKPSSSPLPSIPGHVLLTKLGQGATAQVFSARRALDDAVVALKILHSGLAQHEDVRRRMLSEVETAALLKHPHIVQVQGLIPDTDPPAFSMDFIDGPSLAEFQGRLPYILSEVSVLIMIDVLAGLEHAHSQGVIHRDMKPSNILISKDGRALITDFGLARISEAPTITMAGTILGSPDYMSPEQARGDVLTKRSDLFSAAAVLYFLLTGTRPFGKPSPLATLVAVSNAEFEPVQKRNPKVSAALCRIINKGLSKNPQERFQSAGEFKTALQSYLKSMGLDSATITLPHWMANPSESTMHALKAAAEFLYRRCEQELAAGDRDLAFETISHLSLLAPDSAALVELMQKAEESQNTPAPATTIPNRKGLIFTLLGSAALIILMVMAMPRLQQALERLAPFETPPVAAIPPAAAPHSVIASAPTSENSLIAVSAPAKTIVPPKRERSLGLVRFHVPKGVRVVFDGKEINPWTPLRATPGGHKILLEKPGFPPIIQLIKVDKHEPTDISVN